MNMLKPCFKWFCFIILLFYALCLDIDSCIFWGELVIQSLLPPEIFTLFPTQSYVKVPRLCSILNRISVIKS